MKNIYELLKKNTGMTSDDPIFINCPICNAAASCFLSRTHTYCYSCCYWFPYTYIKDYWYYSKTPSNTYSTKYIGVPNYWDYNTEIENHDLLKCLYAKYKNDPLIAPQIIAEILGEKQLKMANDYI